jgi:DnaJ-class molecular chaperone
MAKQKDYYKILGVTKKADQSEIKKAYRKLAHQYHPDKESGNENKFKEVTEAYAVLGDEKKRAEYDTYGQTFAGPGGGAGFGAGGFDFSQFNGADGFQFDLNDLFSEFFGAGYSRTPKGRDVSIDIQIDFKDSVFGTTKEVIIPMPVHKNGQTTKEQIPIKIKVPLGVNNGEMLRLSGRGEAIPDGSPGDLYVKIHVKPSAKFRKEGPHLVSDIDVKLTDALLGFEYQIESLDGPITVKIPKGINHGELLRVKGRGVPVSENKRGDLLLRLQVKMPSKLSRKAKKLVDQLREEGL